MLACHRNCYHILEIAILANAKVNVTTVSREASNVPLLRPTFKQSTYNNAIIEIFSVDALLVLK